MFATKVIPRVPDFDPEVEAKTPLPWLYSALKAREQQVELAEALFEMEDDLEGTAYESDEESVSSNLTFKTRPAFTSGRLPHGLADLTFEMEQEAATPVSSTVPARASSWTVFEWEQTVLARFASAPALLETSTQVTADDVSEVSEFTLGEPAVSLTAIEEALEVVEAVQVQEPIVQESVQATQQVTDQVQAVQVAAQDQESTQGPVVVPESSPVVVVDSSQVVVDSSPSNHHGYHLNHVLAEPELALLLLDDLLDGLQDTDLTTIRSIIRDARCRRRQRCCCSMRSLMQVTQGPPVTPSSALITADKKGSKPRRKRSKASKFDQALAARPTSNIHLIVATAA